MRVQFPSHPPITGGSGAWVRIPYRPPIRPTTGLNINYT